jgi:hypothetical protein
MFRTIFISLLLLVAVAVPVSARADVSAFATTTSTTTPPIATTTPTTTPPQRPPKPAPAPKPSGPSFFQQLLLSIASMFQPHTTTSTSGGVTTVTTSVTVVTQKPFGGAIISPPITCDAPPGAIYVEVLSGPKPIPIICQPGVCKSYLNGPPAYVAQWLLGNATPVMVDCIKGGVSIGKGYVIGSTPGHGSSGPPSKAPTAPYKPTNSCSNGAITTPAEKFTAENAVRDQLKGMGIGVNRPNACGLNESFTSYIQKNCPTTKSCGCTDVSGLQCNSFDYLKKLEQDCGPFTISGGSEAGHATHNTGNAVDVIGIDSCIMSKYTPIGDGCRYVDSATGTTFLNEGKCLTSGTTGPHFHACLGGKNCR